MAGYSKEMLIDAFVSRYVNVLSDIQRFTTMAEKFYDQVGKDKFRIYASLDPKALREYRAAKN